MCGGAGGGAAYPRFALLLILLKSCSFGCELHHLVAFRRKTVDGRRREALPSPQTPAFADALPPFNAAASNAAHRRPYLLHCRYC